MLLLLLLPWEFGQSRLCESRVVELPSFLADGEQKNGFLFVFCQSVPDQSPLTVPQVWCRYGEVMYWLLPINTHLLIVVNHTESKLTTIFEKSHPLQCFSSQWSVLCNCFVYLFIVSFSLYFFITIHLVWIKRAISLCVDIIRKDFI